MNDGSARYLQVCHLVTNRRSALGRMLTVMHIKYCTATGLYVTVNMEIRHKSATFLNIFLAISQRQLRLRGLAKFIGNSPFIFGDTALFMRQSRNNNSRNGNFLRATCLTKFLRIRVHILSHQKWSCGSRRRVFLAS